MGEGSRGLVTWKLEEEQLGEGKGPASVEWRGEDKVRKHRKTRTYENVTLCIDLLGILLFVIILLSIIWYSNWN